MMCSLTAGTRIADSLETDSGSTVAKLVDAILHSKLKRRKRETRNLMLSALEVLGKSAMCEDWQSYEAQKL